MIGLALAIFVVVGVSWMASPRRIERPIALAAASVADPPAAPVATVMPTPIPAPSVTPESAPVVERVRVSNTLGSGVNLRAKAGERAQRIKTMPEGALLEIIGTDQTADGITWRNVRDANGVTGWTASKFLTRAQQ